MKPNNQYNKELKLVHKLLKQKYHEYLENNKIKSEHERLQYGHAVQIVGYIAHNCDISTKSNKEKNQAQNIQSEPIESKMDHNTTIFKNYIKRT